MRSGEKPLSLPGEYSSSFLKWIAAGCVIGAVGGLCGTAFYKVVELATGIRGGNPWLIYLLPVAGLVIVFFYHLAGMVLDTNTVIHAVHTDDKINWVMAPLIFGATFISHLFGASVGREGAALQLGGVVGSQYCHLFRLDKWDRHVVIMCGMSSVFSAMFGTPVTAALFSLEVAAAGIVHYSGLVPCLISSFTALKIAKLFGAEYFSFTVANVPQLSVVSMVQTLALGVACALLSIVFCRALHGGEALGKKYIKNDYLKVLVGGGAVVLLTLLVGSHRYNGGGAPVIYDAIAGKSLPEDFIMKMAFTVLSVAVGYKGGEIVPSMFVGATFGCAIGPVIGMDAGFAAAVCLAALFCGMVNCPIASIILGLELFGGELLPFIAMACAVSHMLSGKQSLYRAQSIAYSKIKALYEGGGEN